jgi:hypothetical protein
MTTPEQITMHAGAPGTLTFKFDNTAPVAVDDLTASLKALSQAYEDFLIASGHVPPDEGVKLYIAELRTGSIIATLQALADQARLVFGDQGFADTVSYLFDHADTLAGFVTQLGELIEFFLGVRKMEEPPTKKAADQVIKLFEPLAKDSSGQLAIQFNGDVKIGTVNVIYNSQQANAVQNSAKRYLGPSLPSSRVLLDEVLTLHQVKGVPKAQAGDKGIIETVSKSPVKLWYASDDIKRSILELHENPFRLAFIVDVDVKTVDDKPALYKVLTLKDSFERP